MCQFSINLFLNIFLQRVQCFWKTVSCFIYPVWRNPNMWATCWRVVLTLILWLFIFNDAIVNLNKYMHLLSAKHWRFTKNLAFIYSFLIWQLEVMFCKMSVWTDLYCLFLVERVRGDRAQAPDREGEGHPPLQNEDICPRTHRSQVSFLVFLASTQEVQEVYRRDRLG